MDVLEARAVNKTHYHLGALFRFFQEVRVGLRELAGYTHAVAADTAPATHPVAAASPRQQA